jgi:hypothetical protein
MSYSQRYKATIAVHYSGSVSYPPSESGGSKSYSGTAYEDVYVDIDVDTTPFDRSVGQCTNKVDVLTGAVVATEAAQVASIKQKARQVGDTIVNGFFSTVKFEIETQITELTKRVDALLLDIHEKQKKLLALREQMEKDYHRTADRYGNIFGQLDKELENRVHLLDQPVFMATDDMFNAEERFMGSDILNVVALAGKENAILDAQIGTALAKKHARVALNEANTFLCKKKATELTLAACKINDDKEQKYYAPVCCASLTNEHNVQEMQTYSSEFLPKNVSQKLTRSVEINDVPSISVEDKENIDLYFRNLLNESHAENEHASRVKNIISKLYSTL